MILDEKMPVAGHAAEAAASRSVPWSDQVDPALAHYGLPTTAQRKLLTLSENATYAVGDVAGGPASVLRLHRPGYRTEAQIRSELAWLEALHAAGDVLVPAVLKTGAGEPMAIFRTSDGATQSAAMFEYIPGHPIPEDDISAGMKTIGGLAGRILQHAQQWERPGWFTRPTWDVETSMGPAGHWGYWRSNPYAGPREQAVLDAVDLKIRADLGRYAADDGRSTLIHGDMRLANLIANRDGLCVIDFDDCGFSWRMYELACSMSFIEAHPRIEAFVDAWLEGYRSCAAVDRADLDAVPALVMMRRMLLVGWFPTHAHTVEARAMAQSYVADTMHIAEAFLNGRWLQGALRS